MRSRDSSVMRPSPVPASGDDVMVGTSKIVRVSIWFDFRTDEIVSKKVWERGYSTVPDSFQWPENGKSSSFFLKRPDVHLDLTFPAWTGTIMFNYGPRMCETCCSPLQRSINQKAREHSQRSKTGRVCGKRRREVCNVRHTRGARCSDGRTWNSVLSYTPIGTLSLLSFIYRVFLPVSFSVSMRVNLEVSD